MKNAPFTLRDSAFRDSDAGDLAAIEALYPQAFPGEDLLPLLRRLLPDPGLALSLMASRGGRLLGHIAFSECQIEGAGDKLALLGPLAVAPEAQRQGVGAALVEAGLERLTAAGFSLVCVLGDPVYYRRFGFETETAVATPYPLPAEWREAWRSIRLDGGGAKLAGALQVPPPWRDPSLWGAET